ncbi:HAD-IA family hydrolase [Anianabacter salinae]|uniref:HAD-IA family hydrolase n=1 Tax=Anianabacter salinae TaxID=2851023 RepID=UPI00225DCF16|nr:HAD-IA family hydrolase [Anianabacter salinae]MBV0913120.1 HAD-IA family hydrolase [Anianabacter salinae]
MKLRLAIFDVDGTLIDSQNAILAGMSAAFEAERLTAPDRGAVLSIVGLSLPEAMARLAPEADAAAQARLVEGYRTAIISARHMGRAEAAAPLYDGIRDVLDHLRGRDAMLLGAATGKARRGFDHMTDAHGLAGYFQTIQTADLHPSKPHPSMIHAALSDTGIDADCAVMIGDTTFDIEMGRAAGVRTLGVAWGYHAVDALRQAGADAIVDDPRALVASVDEILGTH